MQKPSVFLSIMVSIVAAEISREHIHACRMQNRSPEITQTKTPRIEEDQKIREEAIRVVASDLSKL